MNVIEAVKQRLGIKPHEELPYLLPEDIARLSKRIKTDWGMLLETANIATLLDMSPKQAGKGFMDRVDTASYHTDGAVLSIVGRCPFNTDRFSYTPILPDTTRGLVHSLDYPRIVDSIKALHEHPRDGVMSVILYGGETGVDDARVYELANALNKGGINVNLDPQHSRVCLPSYPNAHARITDEGVDLKWSDHYQTKRVEVARLTFPAYVSIQERSSRQAGLH